jgi:hypothetical protein
LNDNWSGFCFCIVVSDFDIVADQTMSVNERSQVNTPVGTVATTGIVTGFEIIAGNSNNFFKYKIYNVLKS